MKKILLFTALYFYFGTLLAQLTVVATSNNSTICLGDSTFLFASAFPVTYSVAEIANNPIPSPGFQSTFLVNAGVAGTILSSGTLDDGRWDNINLPFTFRYFGTDYNSINISTNGWIGLGSTINTTTGMGVVLPNAAAPNNVIHALTADLNFKSPSTSSLEYFYEGSSPNTKFIIRYNDIKFFGAAGTANVEIILFETTNEIEIHTSDCTNTNLFKAQGIENNAGDVAVTVPGRNNTKVWTGTPDAYRFSPEQFTYSWSPSLGLTTTTGASVSAHPLSSTTYTVTALNPANSETGSTTVSLNINNASYSIASTSPGGDVCQNKSVVHGITYFRDGNCNLIAGIEPAGSNPVANSINSCVTIYNTPGKLGSADLYLARKYDLQPIVNASTSTAIITLYYLQSEFDDYNNLASLNNVTSLPTGPLDASGISNLILRQFHGTGTNPGNYSGSSVDFTTAIAGFSVNWNSDHNWWEIKIPVIGFSGFYITSSATHLLPITLLYFKGNQSGSNHLLNWKANCLSTRVTFGIENSFDGIHFTKIGNIEATQLRCSLPFDFTNSTPSPGINYYRIKIIDIDGRFSYSNIVALFSRSTTFQIINVTPNPVRIENPTLKINAGKSGNIRIVLSDFSGRIVGIQNAQLQQGINQININTKKLAAGIYQLSATTDQAKPQTWRIIKQ